MRKLPDSKVLPSAVPEPAGLAHGPAHLNPDFTDRGGPSIDVGVGRVPAVSRAVALLDSVAASDNGLTLSDIARSLEAPKSSLFNICETLVAERLLRRDAAGRYRIGVRIAEFAAAQLNNPPRLKAVALIVQNFTNPFFHAEAHAIRAAGAAAGVDVTVFDSRQTLGRQVEQLRALATSGTDAVILDPVDFGGGRGWGSGGSRGGHPSRGRQCRCERRGCDGRHRQCPGRRTRWKASGCDAARHWGRRCRRGDPHYRQLRSDQRLSQRLARLSSNSDHRSPRRRQHSRNRTQSGSDHFGPSPGP